MSSILTDIKKLLGINEEDVHFDPDITIHINSALSMLRQIGVGPTTGFSITDKTDMWDDFTEEESLLGNIQTYVYLKVRLIFDPPSSSVIVEAFKERISELEWRLQQDAESILTS
jgi:hypothetical protein